MDLRTSKRLKGDGRSFGRLSEGPLLKLRSCEVAKGAATNRRKGKWLQCHYKRWTTSEKLVHSIEELARHEPVPLHPIWTLDIKSLMNKVTHKICQTNSFPFSPSCNFMSKNPAHNCYNSSRMIWNWPCKSDSLSLALWPIPADIRRSKPCGRPCLLVCNGVDRLTIKLSPV